MEIQITRDDYKIALIENAMKELNGKTFYAVLDKEKDVFEIRNFKRQNKRYLNIGKVKMQKDTHTTASKLKDLIRLYLKNCYICKTTAIKQYKRKNIENLEPDLYVKNPHYSKAMPMQLYDKNLLDYKFA